MGNDAGVFAATGEYDDDDKEADAVWEKIDDYMDERRRVRSGGLRFGCFMDSLMASGRYFAAVATVATLQVACCAHADPATAQLDW